MTRRKDHVMKKRTAGILLGAVVTSMLLSGCGNNEAKEAANESAQVEEEGVGELTEEGEKVELKPLDDSQEKEANEYVYHRFVRG